MPLARAASLLFALALVTCSACNDDSKPSPVATYTPASPTRLEFQCTACAPQNCQPPAASACFQLGTMYEQGKEVPKDAARAKELYAKAAAAGHPGAKAKLMDRPF